MNEAAHEPRVISKTSPVDGRPLGEFPMASADQVDEAVAAARAAWPEWRALSVRERLRRLDRISDLVKTNGEAWAQRIADDTGKPLVDTLMTELMMVPLFMRWYRRHAHRILKRKRARTPMVLFPRRGWIEHDPMGVIAVISPWNFPFNLSVVPMLSALIAGNAVVLKPSEITPITGEVIRELFAKAGLPDGLVQVVQGDGQTGAALCEADVDKIFFTGSVDTGRKVMAAAAKKPIPVELELGGKDAFIVCHDAHLERAAKAAVWGAFVNAGQMCTSVERLLVVDAVYEPFMALVRAEMAKITVGPPEAHADMGPLILDRQRRTVDRHLADARERGARVEMYEAPDEGQFCPPALVTDVTTDMLIWTDETFGPVLPVMRVHDEDEAVRLANDHVFGLTGSVWTRDVKRGRALASRIEAGQVNVNEVVVSVGDPSLPFGGVKHSGIGRYHGDDGLLGFTHTRAVLASGGGQRTEPFWFPYATKYDDMRSLFHHLLDGNLVAALRDQLRLTKDP